MSFCVEQERWLPVPGYEERYEVSDAGRVRNAIGRVLRQWLNHSGYLTVKLAAASHEKKQHRTHSLVAAAFLGPRLTGMTVNHKNCVKTDNRLSNIEYLSNADNVQHAVDSGRYALRSRENLGRVGESNGRHRLTEAEVRAIRLLAKEHSPQELARRFCVTRVNILHIVNYRTWAHVS